MNVKNLNMSHESKKFHPRKLRLFEKKNQLSKAYWGLHHGLKGAYTSTDTFVSSARKQQRIHLFRPTIQRHLLTNKI